MITASDAHQPTHVGTNIVDIYEKTMKKLWFKIKAFLYLTFTFISMKH